MIQGFKVWRITPDNQVVLAGVMAFKQDRLSRIEFRYADEYIASGGIALDPKRLPLSPQKYVFEVAGHDLPGFVDDYLPDRWGEKLIALSLGKRYVSKLDIINNLHKFALLSDIVITPYLTVPIIKNSISLGDVEHVLTGESLDFSNNEMVIKHLPLFVAGGGSPGGARPKLLINDNGQQWLYKFNLHGDPFDMSIAEWASLEVAHRAGLNVPRHEIVALGGATCLRVQRFDVSPQQGRYHLLTMNSLLKNEGSSDPHIASYEDIARLIRQYSDEPTTDCRLLLGQLLINSELKNTDDHLRNFSFINNGEGWRLSPVYDIVPDPTTGKYHQIRLSMKDYLPTLEEAVKAGTALGISLEASRQIADNVRSALAQWPDILKETKITDPALVLLKNIVRSELYQKPELEQTEDVGPEHE